MTNKIMPAFFIVLFLLATSADLLAEPNKVYTIGVIPQFEVNKLRKIWKPILKRLEEETGLKFTLKGAPTIPAFEKELLAGNFDFSYMNPYQIVIANKLHGYTPLIRDHSKKLQGILVVRKDSDIKSITDLNNETLAFPSPNALGASLLIRSELYDKHKIKIIPRYVKTHDSVYLNVFLKQVKAGGGVGKTFNKQSQRLKDSLNIIYKSSPVSPHPFAAHPRVSLAKRSMVHKAFIEISKTTSGASLLAQIPIKKLGDAKIEDYQEIKAMNLERFTILNSRN